MTEQTERKATLGGTILAGLVLVPILAVFALMLWGSGTFLWWVISLGAPSDQPAAVFQEESGGMTEAERQRALIFETYGVDIWEGTDKEIRPAGD